MAVISAFSILFFVGVCLIYYLAKDAAVKKGVLLLSSYVYCWAWDPRFVIVILLVSVVNFGLNALMFQTSRRKQTWLVVAVLFNVSALALFKYVDFLVETAVGAMSQFGVELRVPHLSLFLPIGISFYTFHCLSFGIDNYRGHIARMPRFLDFSLYLAFFPKLVAGPILRPNEFFPQVLQLKRFSSDDAYAGVQRIIIGLFKKLVIASFFERRATVYFSSPEETLTALQVIDAGACYGLQLYYDFSGYTDLAIGSARILGFSFPDNFRSPYASRTVSDFWRRWHITLSEWFRDYVYIPLGGSRVGRWRTRLNLMSTMLLVGLWHGPSWNFVAWGGVHGAYLAVGHARAKRGSPTENPTLMKDLGNVLAVFLLISLAWICFRAPDLHATADMFGGLFHVGSGLGHGRSWVDLILIIGFGPLLQYFAVFSRITTLTQRHALFDVGLYVILLLLIVLAGHEPQEFIYSRF